MDPQSFNAYSYAQNNPITGKDPDGLALTAAQNDALHAIKAQLQAISAALSSADSGGGGQASQSTLNSVQDALNSAKAAVSRIASGGNATVAAPAFVWAPPLPQGNSVTSPTPYQSPNGLSGVPGSNNPTYGNAMLTALSFTPVAGELGPDEILIGGQVFKFGIKHGHTIEHLAEMGLTEAEVETAIVKDMMAKSVPALKIPEAQRIITIGDINVVYRPYQWAEGIINVGTYFLLRP